MLRAINSYRGTAAFSSWLYRIAENVCIDFFRRQKYHTEPLHLIDDAELREHLQSAIEHLTPIRRRVFLLYYHHELPIKAIATQIRRSEGTIKSHLRNARRQLQELLTPYLNTKS